MRTVVASMLSAVAFAPPWSEPVTIGEGGRQPNFPSIAFGTDGTGVVSWTPATKPNEPQPPSWLGNTLLVFRNYNVLRASFRAAGEPAFRAPEDVSPPGEFVRNAVVAADPRSRSATVIWEGVTGPRPDPLQQTIRMARRPLR